MSKNFSKKQMNHSTKEVLEKHVRQLHKSLQTLQGKALNLGKNTFYLSLGVLESLKNPFGSFENILWKKGKISSKAKPTHRH